MRSELPFLPAHGHTDTRTHAALLATQRREQGPRPQPSTTLTEGEQGEVWGCAETASETGRGRDNSSRVLGT